MISIGVMEFIVRNLHRYRDMYYPYAAMAKLVDDGLNDIQIIFIHFSQPINPEYKLYDTNS